MKGEITKRSISSIILILVSLYIIIVGSYLFNSFIIIIALISLFEWHKMTFKNFYYFPGVIFILISFYSVYLIRNEFNEYSLFNFLLILSICILTDIGGFLFGKVFKGPKLTKISPNKTYSGALGGLVLSLIGSIVFLNISNYFYIKNDMTYNNLLIFSFTISIISQLGDLIISFFKRLSNLKDTGNIIPGHGGILDRIDGMIFVFPISYFLNFV